MWKFQYSQESMLLHTGQQPGSWMHLRQGRRVVIGDEVRPEEQLWGQKALVLHAAGLLAALPGVKEAVAPGVLLWVNIILAELLRAALMLYEGSICVT